MQRPTNEKSLFLKYIENWKIIDKQQICILIVKTLVTKYEQRISVSILSQKRFHSFRLHHHRRRRLCRPTCIVRSNKRTHKYIKLCVQQRIDTKSENGHGQAISNVKFAIHRFFLSCCFSCKKKRVRSVDI